MIMAVPITDINQLDLNKRYTYQDYLSWQFDELVELIRGKIVRMSPAPNTGHQRISSNLHGQLWSFLRGKNCQVFSAPFDVRLPVGENETVVQPDICVICDPEKLDHRGCKGAPDWIIEILSKSTAQKDLTDKFELYEQAGVHEYWAVHPEEGTVLIYRLDDAGRYQLLRQRPFTSGESVSVGVLPDLQVDFREVFG
jgi:Uma2 family endonuclease